MARAQNYFPSTIHSLYNPEAPKQGHNGRTSCRAGSFTISPLGGFRNDATSWEGARQRQEQARARQGLEPPQSGTQRLHPPSQAASAFADDTPRSCTSYSQDASPFQPERIWQGSLSQYLMHKCVSLVHQMWNTTLSWILKISPYHPLFPPLHLCRQASEHSKALPGHLVHHLCWCGSEAGLSACFVLLLHSVPARGLRVTARSGQGRSAEVLPHLDEFPGTAPKTTWGI